MGCCIIVDIIIPVYNSKATLPVLLSSISMQTYKDINVIIIDDCSNEIYDDIIKSYKRLLNITYKRLDKNVGSGEARNQGINISNNEYLIFCDSDDSLLNAFAVEKMVSDIKSKKYDFCSYGYVQQCEKLQFSSIPCNATWIFGKIYSRDFINKYNIQFAYERFNEDVAWNQICYSLADNIYKTNETYYLHHINENSVTKTEGYSVDDMDSFARNYLYAYNFVKDKKKLSNDNKWQFIDGLLILYNFYTEMVRSKDESYCKSFRQKIIDYYSAIFDFAQPLICSDDFIEHYTSIHESHGIHHKKLICTIDWYSFINDIEMARREEFTSLF